LGKLKMKNIKKMHIIEYLKDAPSQNDKKLILNSLFNFAVKWEVIDKNPVKYVETKKKKKRNSFYTEKEIIKMLDCLECENDRLNIIVILALFGGLKRSEIHGITNQ